MPATQSAICDIDGEKGLLTYRGYPMQELALHSSFLETAYLLIWGELPTRDQLNAFEMLNHRYLVIDRAGLESFLDGSCYPKTAAKDDAGKEVA